MTTPRLLRFDSSEPRERVEPVRVTQRLRNGVAIAGLALTLAALGGAKADVLIENAGTAGLPEWASSHPWRAVLLGSAIAEIALAVCLVVVPDPRRPVRWTMRICALYVVVLLVGEVFVNAFSQSCGCFGSGIRLGLWEHLLALGILLLWACAIDRSLAGNARITLPPAGQRSLRVSER